MAWRSHSHGRAPLAVEDNSLVTDDGHCAHQVGHAQEVGATEHDPDDLEMRNGEGPQRR